MKLLVDRLTETPTALSFSASKGWWLEHCGRDPAVEDALTEAVEFSVRAHKMGADLYLEGEAEGVLELTCGRCLERYRQPIREGFRLVLEPAGNRVPADPEGAALLARDGLFLSDELEAGWFRGSEVDLRSFVQEVIALVIPVQPVCREECRGLCPRCGVDRNQESCGCVEIARPSPFAVLESLRTPGGGGKDR